MTTRLILLFSLLMAAMGMTGCAPSNATPLALAAGEQFHHQLDQGEFKAIYDACLPEFKATAKEEAFVKALSALHARLGTVQSATALTPTVTSHHFKTNVAVSYTLRFEKGNATETLTFRIDGGKAILCGYEEAEEAPKAKPKGH